jgi:hypothetical protein
MLYDNVVAIKSMPSNEREHMSTAHNFSRDGSQLGLEFER